MEEKKKEWRRLVDDARKATAPENTCRIEICKG